MDLISPSDRSIIFLSLARGGVENVDLAEARDRAAVAHRISLSGFAFAIVGGAVQFVRGLASEAVAGLPEIRRARLIGDVPQHLAHFPVPDFPESLAAELEIVTLLINGPASVAENQDAVVHAGHKVVERYVLPRGLERYVGHARKGNAAPTVRMETAVGLRLPDQRRQVPRGL